jgi:hypothetical protein
MTGAKGRALKIGAGTLTPRHHATSDVVFDAEEAEFLKAMDDFKRRTGKQFPTWTDALAVLRNLGWTKAFQWEEDVEVVIAG